MKYFAVYLFLIVNCRGMQPDCPQFLLKSIKNNIPYSIVLKNLGTSDTTIQPHQEWEIQKQLPIISSNQDGSISSPPDNWKEEFGAGNPNNNPYIAHLTIPNKFFAFSFTYYPSIPGIDPQISGCQLNLELTRQSRDAKYLRTRAYTYAHKIHTFYFSIIVNSANFEDDQEVIISTDATPGSLATLCLCKVIQFEQEKKLTISKLPTDINDKITKIKAFIEEFKKKNS